MREQQQAVLTADFDTMPAMVRLHAQQAPTRRALVQGGQSLSYAELDALMDRVAASLQRAGLRMGDAIAICAGTSLNYAAVFLGALRAGVVVAPLAPGVIPASLQGMLRDADAKLLFLDASVAETVGPASADALPRIALDDSDAGVPFTHWLVPVGAQPQPVVIAPELPFNISTPLAPRANPKASCNRTACAGLIPNVRPTTVTGRTR